MKSLEGEIPLLCYQEEIFPSNHFSPSKWNEKSYLTYAHKEKLKEDVYKFNQVESCPALPEWNLISHVIVGCVPARQVEI